MKFPKWFGIVLAALFCLASCGCTLPLVYNVVDSLPWPEGRPYDAELVRSFDQTVIKQSSSADVLSALYGPQYETLSQSESVLAACGQKKNGREKWLNVVAFDEDLLTARHKCLLIVDENPATFLPPRHKCRIDIETAVKAEFFDKPYANENAMRIAILRHVLEGFNNDVRQVRTDNKDLDICAMLVNQVLNGLVVQLDESPAKASQLEDQDGLAFDHITLGRGKIRMVTRGDIVKVKIKIGSLASAFGKQQDVLQM